MSPLLNSFIIVAILLSSQAWAKEIITNPDSESISSENLIISANENKSDHPVEAYHRIHRVIDGKTEKLQIATCYSYTKEACAKQVPVGNYLIRSAYNNFQQETPVEIKAGETSQLAINMGQTGKVEIITAETADGEWVEAYHSIYKINTNTADNNRMTSCYSYKKEPCTLQLSIGKYLVKSIYQNFQLETPCEVKMGNTSKLQVIMGQTGKVEIAAQENEEGMWIEAYHSIYRMVNGEVASHQTKNCYSYKKEACIAQIPVGKYLIRSRYNKVKQEMPFEIKAGETSQLIALMK